MSVWSGLVAGGLGIALALVAVGMSVWEWHSDDANAREDWTYGPFSARHMLFNKTTNQTDALRNYSYGQLAAVQPNMAKAMSEYGLYLILGVLAAIAGAILSVLTWWKKLRGIFAGVVFLAACASILYPSFTLVFAIPEAARLDINAAIQGIDGRLSDNSMVWRLPMGWFLPIGSGLALAWASSDLWHLRPAKKGLPMKVDLTLSRVGAPTNPDPPLPVEPAPVVVHEPLIEEVFVIGANGLLIKHMSRSLMTDKDRDVVGGMISAISSFVREAFSERDGDVQEVSLGDHHFVMCNEGGVVVAVLVTSGNTEDIVPRLRRLLGVLRDRYVDRLAHWQGEPLEGIEDELAVLWDPHPLPPPPAE